MRSCERAFTGVTSRPAVATARPTAAPTGAIPTGIATAGAVELRGSDQEAASWYTTVTWTEICCWPGWTGTDALAVGANVLRLL